MNKQVPNRNAPCFCGSGKKYKKCCLGLSKDESINPDPVLSLKKAHYQMKANDLDQAETMFKEVLSIDKNSIEGLVGLGQCLCQQWRENEGFSFLLKAGKILLRQAKKTKDVRHLLDLTYLMVELHASDKAVPLINEALTIAPKHPRAHHTKALALQKKNSKVAYSSAKKAVEFAPNESNAIILLATLEAKEGERISAKKRLQVLLNKDMGVDLARVNLELGVIEDKLGNYEQAFCHFDKSGKLNQEKPEVIAFDKKAVYQDIEHSKQMYDAEYFQKCGQREHSQKPTLVFLIGFYRSGTTLMEQILGAHPQVETSDEAYIIPCVAREISRISKTKGTLQEKVKALTEEQIEELRKFYWLTAETMMDTKLSNKVFVDKATMNTLNLGLINTLFPEAIVLFAIRDPRDVVLSCFMQSFNLSPLTVNFLEWSNAIDFYCLVMGYWLHVRNDLTMFWMELRYEDVLNDIEGQFTPLFEKLGLEWSLECEKFYKYAQTRAISTPSFDQVTKPIYHSSVQRWKNYEGYFKEYEERLGFYVQYFKYNSGDEWVV